MITSTLLGIILLGNRISASLGGQDEILPTIILVPDRVVLDEKLTYDALIDKENQKQRLEAIGLQSTTMNGKLLGWSTEFFDQHKSDQMIAGWRKIAGGDIKIGDSVSLKSVWGLFPGAEDYLLRYYGVNEKTASDASLTLGAKRIIQLEDSDGNVINVPVVTRDQQKYQGTKPFVRTENTESIRKEAEKNYKSPIGNDFKFQFFGSLDDELDRLETTRQLSEYLHDQKEKERAAVADGYARWLEKLVASQGSYQNGSTELSEEEKNQINQVLPRLGGRGGKLSNYKVKSSETVPIFMLRVQVDAMAHMEVPITLTPPKSEPQKGNPPPF